MFVFVPIGIAAYHMKAGPVAIFTLNFLAIVPQAWLMGKATEDCAAAAGDVIGGLLNAWFGTSSRCSFASPASVRVSSSLSAAP